MKVTTALAVLVFAAASNAAAEPGTRRLHNSVHGDKYCGFRGGSCVKANRDADPKAYQQSLQTVVCGLPGNPCHKAKRAALAVAEAIAVPEPRRKSRPIIITSCGFPGGSCVKARRSLEHIGNLTSDILDKALWVDEDEEVLARRDELVPHFPKAYDTDDPDAEIGEVSDETLAGHSLQCFSEDGECDLLEKAQESFHAAVKREARRRKGINWDQSCGFWGGSCVKAKREAEPRRKTGYILTWCGFPGSSCRRDIADLERERAAYNPEVLKAQEACYGPDGECTAAEKQLGELESALSKATEANKVPI